MSWDLFAFDAGEAATVAELADDYRPAALGSRDAVIARIRSVAPGADFGDPSWGVINGDGWSIEVNIGVADPCDGFALHVRGGGDALLDMIAAILDATGVRALDAQTGAFFDRAAAGASLSAWRTYRDQAVGDRAPDS